MDCQNCGKQNIADAKFCKYCGTKIEAVESQAKHYDEPTYEEVMLDKVQDYANTEMLKGVLWFFGSIGITLVGFIFADVLGSSIGLVFWGAMLYGVVRLVMGIYYKVFPRKLMHKVDYLEKD